MFTPDVFQIIGLILGLISIRTLVTTVRNRQRLFDDQFTASERQQVSEIAFFLLLPLSVALHEAGHAAAVRAFGGQIEGFGWYFFYGFVAHSGFYTAADLFWIALAGNLVSIVLGLAAIAIPLLRPFRPPVNYLLFVFGAISLLNSLVFYPALDLIGNFVGDWSQIYSRDTPVLSGATAVIHVALLLTAFLLWRSDRGRRIYATRTGLPAYAMRRLSPVEAGRELLEAGESAARSWRHPLRVVSESPDDMAGVTLHWTSNGYGRVVAAYAVLKGRHHLELFGGIRDLSEGTSTLQQPIELIDGIPPAAQLGRALLKALDTVDRWGERQPLPVNQEETEG